MKYSETKKVLLDMFDPDKLACKPDEWGFHNEIERDITTIGFATNLTQEVIQQAHQSGIELLLTHHDAWDFMYGMREACHEQLAQNHITHAFFHAPLDDADFGTASTLAKSLGITVECKAVPYSEVYHCGVIGHLEPLGFDVFTSTLTTVLGESIRAYQNNTRPVAKIGIITGGGSMTTDIKQIVDFGCDTYITGEYSLYTQQFSKFAGINLLVGSHTRTEIFGVREMANKLKLATGINVHEIGEPNY